MMRNGIGCSLNGKFSFNIHGKSMFFELIYLKVLDLFFSLTHYDRDVNVAMKYRDVILFICITDL